MASYLASPTSANATLLEQLISPSVPTAPFYLVPDRSSLIPGLSDRYLSVGIPVVIYWLLGGLFFWLDKMEFPYFEARRIHESPEVERRNRVTMPQLLRAVLLQHTMQTILGLLWLAPESEVQKTQVFVNHAARMAESYAPWVIRLTKLAIGPRNAVDLLSFNGGEVGRRMVEFSYWWGYPILQFGAAFFIIDTHQFFLHKAMHEVPWLYRNFHSHHHRLYVPYAFGALYNHWLEGLVLDSLGAALAEMATGMTVRQTVLLFGFASAKTVDDHSGYRLWWDPLQMLFANNADYHDIHHQSFGIKSNFSQPFFTRWDYMFSTIMTREQVANRRRPAGLTAEGEIEAVQKEYKLE